MRRVFLLVLLVFAGFVVFADSAAADVLGPCEAKISDVDLKTNKEVYAMENQLVVNYSFSAPSPVTDYKVYVFFGPYKQTIASGSGNGENTVSGQVPIADYAKYGKGKYQIQAEIKT